MPNVGRPSPLRAWLLVAGLALAATVLPDVATAEPARPGPEPATAGKLQTLRDLLADPDIQALLPRNPSAATEAPAPATPPDSMAGGAATRLDGFRAHLLAVLAHSSNLGREAGTARAMVAEALDQRGWLSVGLFFAGFVGLGFGTEALFRAAMRPAQTWLLALTLESVRERVRAVFARLVYGAGMALSFAVGSVGAFLLLDWPAVLREAVLGYLIAFLSVRLVAVMGRMLLAPGAARFRVVPITTPGATFVYRRWIAVATLVGFAWQTIDMAGRFGLSPLSVELCGNGLALLVLLVGLEAVWRAPRMRLATVAESRADSFLNRHEAGLRLARSAVLVALWLLWAAGAERAFWLLAFAVAVPFVVVIARGSVNHVLRPAGSSVSVADSKTLDVVVFERGVRGLILVGAALLLARILGVDFTTLAMRDTLPTRVVRGAVGVVVIVLAADFLWHVCKALIDRRLATGAVGHDDAAEAANAARLRTLLPILSNVLLIVIVVVAAMMALAAAGVEIGPLVASAGVVGVAIGFGAQTLVKDVISGIFYLIDDAFRVGEYIQSGSYKGTVESFSLRSVKLRHQRGALYTVPFGILGAVQNQSRDWVVDKIALNVPYGTDLDRVRKLVKKVGETLADDPELGPGIINPLKMQGVVQFGDFAIQIQTKMMTKPGDVQFLARRRALLMINKTFNDNGIGFAVPTVQVSGDAQGAASAAAQVGLRQVAQLERH